MNETSTYIHLDEVIDYSIGQTLADEPVNRQWVMLDITLKRIAHGYDIHVGDIQVVNVDVMREDTYRWGVDLVWWVPCHECEQPANIEGVSKFVPLCHDHWLEAIAQEAADLENDDIKAGIRQP